MWGLVCLPSSPRFASILMVLRVNDQWLFGVENQSTFKLGYITIIRTFDILYLTWAIILELTVIPSYLSILSNLDAFNVWFQKSSKVRW